MSGLKSFKCDIAFSGKAKVLVRVRKETFSFQLTMIIEILSNKSHILQEDFHIYSYWPNRFSIIFPAPQYGSHYLSFRIHNF